MPMGMTGVKLLLSGQFPGTFQCPFSKCFLGVVKSLLRLGLASDPAAWLETTEQFCCVLGSGLPDP